MIRLLAYIYLIQIVFKFVALPTRKNTLDFHAVIIIHVCAYILCETNYSDCAHRNSNCSRPKFSEELIQPKTNNNQCMRWSKCVRPVRMMNTNKKNTHTELWMFSFDVSRSSQKYVTSVGLFLYRLFLTSQKL